MLAVMLSGSVIVEGYEATVSRALRYLDLLLRALGQAK